MSRQFTDSHVDCTILLQQHFIAIAAGPVGESEIADVQTPEPTQCPEDQQPDQPVLIGDRE